MPLVLEVTVEMPDGSRRESRAIGPVVPVGRNVMHLGSFLGGVYVDDPHVSREHALVIVEEGGELVVKDLGSRNGVVVGTKRLGAGEAQRLGHDGKFDLGGLPVTVRVVDNSRKGA